MLPIVLLFGAYVGALHLRPYPFPASFEVILPDETCGEVCVMGITPGMTTLAEAQHILETHPYVQNTVLPDSAMDIVRWQWSEDGPPWLLGSPAPSVRAATDDVIYTLRIQTDVPLKHFRVRLGLPDASNCFSNLNSVECIDIYEWQRAHQRIRYSLQTSLAEVDDPLEARARVTISVEDLPQ